jgi:hypothetical protein
MHAPATGRDHQQDPPPATVIGRSLSGGTVPVMAKPPSKPGTLAMSAELMKMLGVGKTRLHQLRQEPDWPRPIDSLSGGDVFAIADIREWAKNHGRTLHPLDD